VSIKVKINKHISLKQTINVMNMKNHKNKGFKKGLNLIFKQGQRQDYVIQKQEHKN
jgi:hypothetical protein